MAFCVSQMVSSLMIALTETSPSAARQIKNFNWFVFILCFLSLVGIEPGHFNDPSFFATPVIERSLSLLVVIIIHRLYCLYRNTISYVHWIHLPEQAVITLWPVPAHYADAFSFSSCSGEEAAGSSA